jgi:hypothetical protein
MVSLLSFLRQLLPLSIRHSRIGTLIVVVGVLGVLVVVFQLDDVLPFATSRNGSSGTIAISSSLIDCSNRSLGQGIRRHDNSWGALDPVVISKRCTNVNASAISSNPLDWLELCHQNHDIYQRYMDSTAKNYLKDIVERAKQPNATIGKDKMTLLVIGDSLDRYMVNHVCRITGAIPRKVDPKVSYRRPFVCSSPVLEIGFFNIFGMYRTCENGGAAYGQDRRSFNTTVERLTTLLPDVLSRLSQPPQHVQVGSALWDLSQGCVGRNFVSHSYREEYVLGIQKLYDFLVSDQSGVNNNASIVWRTSPAMRRRYSAKWVALSLIPFNLGAHGRTRRNQRILNRLLIDTVTTKRLGTGIVDWWKIVHGTTERFLNEELLDGRHYSFCSTMAFFNEWLAMIKHL